MRVLWYGAPSRVGVGKSQIAQLAGQRSGTDLSRYLLAISKKSGKFAYYIEEDNGTVTLNYDLLKGKKVG